MNHENLITATENHVSELYRQHQVPGLIYHSLLHTQEVVQVAEQISAHYQLSDDDQLVVHASAWFHDVGYLFGPPETHEMIGAEKAAEFLQAQGINGEIIEKVKGCILATRLPQTPHNLLEEIICDADLFHFGNESFAEKNKLMRKEKELILGTEIGGSVWREGAIRLLQSHNYFTDYVKTLLKKGKEENLAILRKKQEKKLMETEKQKTGGAPKENGLGKKKGKEFEDDEERKKPTRGIETMFRLTSTNHLDLSAMADSKANIMISVNSIIVSVLVSVLLRHLEDFPNLVLPFITFLTVNVCTIIFAVLATRPNVTKGTFTREDIQQKKANLLFFGNFHRMNLGDYEWGMKELMRDREFLYSSMIRDIYFLGVVLGKKYRLLRISYNIFMYGFVIAVLSFAIAVLFFPAQ
jgi:predicted metal-dependent HD superfamily phosphohydrolase